MIKIIIMVFLSVLLLTSCATSQVVKDAKDQAEANRILDNSVSEKLIAYNYSKQQSCKTNDGYTVAFKEMK